MWIGSQNRRWSPGAGVRFPILSLICLSVIFAAGVGSVIVLLVSENQDVDVWCSGRIHTKASVGDKDAYSYRITVGAWIALFVFLAGKALAVMFTEAITISWWVAALEEESLHRLHSHWQAGQSIFDALSKPRFFGWVVVASITFTAFTGLETLLQNASSSTTILSTYPTNFTATLASALPDGFSGIYAGIAHDGSEISYLTPQFAQILQDFTAKVPMKLDLQGCETTSNVSCTTNVTGVGFSYTCQSERLSLLPLIVETNNTVTEPSNTFFNVGFDWSIWQISLTTLWKDQSDYTGDVVISQNCSLVPALVSYPVNVSQNEVTLQPSGHIINWTANHAEIDPTSQQVDPVIKVLPIPSLDAPYADMPDLSISPGTYSTLGGIYLALDKLYTSSIWIQDDITYAADIHVEGPFAYSFALFDNGVEVNTFANNTFTSPMPQLLANIREIMLRSSLAIVQRQIGNYALNNGTFHLGSNDSNVTSTYPGQRQIYHSVYKTDRTILTIAISLMTLAVIAMLPLYHGYWRLGRKVSLSPLELAKALHNTPSSSSSNPTKPSTGGGGGRGVGEEDQSTEFQDQYQHQQMQPQSSSVLDVNRPGRLPQDGSNYEIKELLKLLGNVRVRYGEIAPGELGFGHVGSVTGPKEGTRYR